MTTIQSPANISILLHCHCDPRPLSACFSDDADAHEADMMGIKPVRELFEIGAIQYTGNGGIWRTTDLGRAWVKALCDTPPPTPVFADALGRVIITDY